MRCGSVVLVFWSSPFFSLLQPSFQLSAPILRLGATSSVGISLTWGILPTWRHGAIGRRGRLPVGSKSREQDPKTPNDRIRKLHPKPNPAPDLGPNRVRMMMTMQEGDHDSRATGHRRARDAGSGELQRRTTPVEGPTTPDALLAPSRRALTGCVLRAGCGRPHPANVRHTCSHAARGQRPSIPRGESRDRRCGSQVLELSTSNSNHRCHVISGPKEARRQLGPCIAASKMGEVLLHVACAPCRAASWHPASGNESKGSQVCGWCN